MKITIYSPLFFLLAIAVVGISNAQPLVAQTPPEQVIDMMNTIGQQIITQVENSPCENFASSIPETNSTNSQHTFKVQIASQFINIFQRLLQDAPETPELFRQTSSLMFNKLSKCGLVPTQR